MPTKLPVGLRLKPEALQVMDAAAAARPDYRPGYGRYNATALTGLPRGTASTMRKTVEQGGAGRPVRIRNAMKMAGLHAERTGQDPFSAMRELFYPIDDEGNVLLYDRAEAAEASA